MSESQPAVRSDVPEPQSSLVPVPPYAGQVPDVIVKTETRGAIVSAPLSYTGSCQRIWRWTGDLDVPNWLHITLLTVAALIVIPVVWTFVTAWYLFFGLWLVPYRLIRRGQRKRKVEARRHAELLAAMQIHQKSQNH
jgi:hypothetical protein